MKKILFLFFLIPIISLSQNTYYIDATNGNDNNNGLSASSPWKTISKVNDHSFIAGDIILFKRDEIWIGERLYIENLAGSSLNKITYTAYGSGEKPIISSVELQSINWTYTANNIWKATNPPTEHPERLLINDLEVLRANTLSELDGVQYFWFYNNNTNDLYIYATSNPVNLNISYSTDFPLIIENSNNINIENIDFQGGWTSIFITTGSKNIHLNNLNIGKYSTEGVIVSTDVTAPIDYPKNIDISNCYFDAFFSFDYANAGTQSDDFNRGSSDGIRTEVLINGTIQNCYFKNWGHASINIDGVNVSNVIVANNYLTSPDICYGGRIGVDDANHVEVYNNQIINTSVQSQLNGQDNHYHHNIFYGTKDTPLPDVDAGIALQGYSNSIVKNNLFENNIILNTKGPAIHISGNNDFDIFDNVFSNNIIYNCGQNTNGKSIVIEPNEYELTYNNSFLNNLVYNENTTQTCDYRLNTTNISAFNNVNSDGYQIENNIVENPLLVAIDNEDYHLTANSPCINSGINTIATQDFEGNPIPLNGTLPDIGIYEYQQSLSVSDDDISQNIMLFPNPTNGYITIKGFPIKDIKKIIVLDVLGKIVIDNVPNLNILSIHSLNKGVYYLKIISVNNHTTIKKIILK